MFLTAQEIIDLQMAGALAFDGPLFHRNNIPSIPLQFSGLVVRGSTYLHEQTSAQIKAQGSQQYRSPLPQGFVSPEFAYASLADFGVSSYSSNEVQVSPGEAVLVGTTLRHIGDCRDAKMLYSPPTLAQINGAMLCGPVLEVGEYCPSGPVVFLQLMNTHKATILTLREGDALGHICFIR